MLKEGDKNTKFFHGMASLRIRMYRISAILDGENRVEKKDDITNLIIEYFVSLYSWESWDRPTRDNLDFNCIGMERASWLKRKFKEEEVREAIFSLAGDKADRMVSQWLFSNIFRLC